MTVVFKNVHISRLDEIFNKYKITNHRRIEIKPVDFKLSTYFDYDVEHNEQDLN